MTIEETQAKITPKQRVIALLLIALGTAWLMTGLPLSQFALIVTGLGALQILGLTQQVMGRFSGKWALFTWLGLIAATVVIAPIVAGSGANANPAAAMSLITMLIFVPFATVGEEFFTAVIAQSLGGKITGYVTATTLFVLVHAPEYGGLKINLLSILASRLILNYALSRFGIKTSGVAHAAFDVLLFSFALLAHHG